MDYLAACCVFKDELRYLREWIEYHRLIGVERFYMASNDDSPEAARDLLNPYIQRGEVFFYSRPGGPFVKFQMDIYIDLLRAAMGRARWLAFLDVDEFLLPVEAGKVPEVLARYERHAALAVNSACFGSSGLKEAPALQTASFRMRLPDDHDENRIYKSIIDPTRVIGVHNPHQFILAEPWTLVDEFGARVTHPWRNENNPFFGARLRINHYRLRSTQEFAEKVARWQDNHHPEFRDPEAVRQYWERSDRCEVADDTIQRFVPELRQRLTRA
ncbi:MAG TPA: glycosyltransferase family 92 protein [Burkholderiales bacterium]